jgi:uncharacterized LabA/DUF88 family protein
MANHVYVDNSNYFIEGQRLSAVRTGMALTIADANSQRILDLSWRGDFGRLYEFTGAGKDGRATLYGSRPPQNDTLWGIAQSRGFQVKVFDRSFFTDKEKKVDSSMAVDMIDDLYTLAKDGDEFTLVAGDGDHIPAVEKIVSKGYPVYVVFWTHATARELREIATRFVPLDERLDYLAMR